MTVYIGVDLHKTQFTVHMRVGDKIESLSEIKQYPTTSGGYADFFARIAEYKSAGFDVKIGVESTGNTRYFKTQVENAGAEVTVINTLKFKVINESTKKTDKHDASTISEFLAKDMLPESHVCSAETENLRRLIKSRERLVRSIVGQKNEVHALLVSMGLSDKLRSLQSKKGRQKVLDTLLSHSDLVLEAQSVKLMFQIIDQMTEADIRENLSRNIKTLRTIQKISQAELAEKADISIPFLSQIECGNKFPSPAILARLADSLNSSVSDLFADKDVIKKEDQKFVINAMKSILEGQLKSFEDFCKAYL